MHTGDFSQLLAGGAQYTIYDPATRVAAAGGRFQQTAFPGNRIPASRFDKVGAAILGYYPTAEKTPGDPLGLSNYQDASTAEKADYYNYTTRVDQNLGDKQRFFLFLAEHVRVVVEQIALQQNLVRRNDFLAGLVGQLERHAIAQLQFLHAPVPHRLMRLNVELQLLDLE